MKPIFLGLDLGYRYTDSSSGRETLTVPSVTSPFSSLLTTSNGLRRGVVTSPVQGMAGHTAIKQGAKPDSVLTTNKNFTGPDRKELSAHTKILLFHAIRAHIPQDVDKVNLCLCLAVPRADYDIAVEAKTGERYSPVERAFAEILEREWTVQNDGGTPCRVTILKVKVKPQPELALYSQIFRYDAPTDTFFDYDKTWMYKEPLPLFADDSQAQEDALSNAVQTVVFDIGSFTSHAERLTVIDGSLTAVRSRSANIGMWTMLDDIKHVIFQETGENNLAPHQAMQIFEQGRYGSRSLVPEFQALLLRHWDAYDALFKSAFTNYEEVDRVLCTGRGWLKFDRLFRDRYRAVSEQHHFTITIPTDGRGGVQCGTLIADGAFKVIRAWGKQHGLD